MIVLACAFFLWRVVRSPFGHVLRGIHENEARMQAVGYPVNRYKLAAFVIAGMLAGVAGSLYTQLVGSISPSAFLWTTSGEALLMVIIGGTGTLFGGILGAAAFILLQSLVSSYTERWMLILGLTFVLLVLFAPGGIAGGAARARGAARVTECLRPWEGLTRHFGALKRGQRRLADRGCARAARHHRAQRRGEDDALQPHHRASRPERGRHRLRGSAGGGAGPHVVARRGLSRSFQRNNLFPRLTVQENPPARRRRRRAGELESAGLGGAAARARRWRARETAAAVGLAERLDALAGQLSYGEQRQLEVGVALATAPRLLLPDEPTAGMSPEETLRMTRMLESLPREVTLLIIEHWHMDVVGLAGRPRHGASITGEVLTEGAHLLEVKADPRVYEVYLGSA